MQKHISNSTITCGDNERVFLTQLVGKVFDDKIHLGSTQVTQ